MIKALLWLFRWVPLRWTHAMGALLGRAVYALSPVYASRLRENLAQSALAPDPRAFRALLASSIGEAGKSFTEILSIWVRNEQKAAALVVDCPDREVALAAYRRGKGIIFLTPHLGCFEVCAVYAAQFVPLTVLYRPPKLKWVEALLVAGRGRGRVRLAPTDLWGVRRLYLALRAGEAVGLLPDQAPGTGEGVWAPFFGRPAYTMTLAMRLRKATGAPAILAFAERLPAGRGYRIHLRELPENVSDPAALNREIEGLIRRCPSQYLWSYNRYKVPAGAAPPAKDVPGQVQ